MWCYVVLCDMVFRQCSGAVLYYVYLTNFQPLTLTPPPAPARSVLRKALLQHTLEYLGPQSSAKGTCKYWRALLSVAATDAAK